MHGSKEEWARLIWIADIARTAARRRRRLDLRARPRGPGGHSPHAADRRRAGESTCSARSPRPRRRGRWRMTRPRGGWRPQAAAGCSRAAANTPSVYHLSGFRLRMRERMTDRVGYVAATLFTARAQHFRFIDLPEWLAFLYPLVRIGHDYVALPLWRLTHSAHAMRPAPARACSSSATRACCSARRVRNCTPSTRRPASSGATWRTDSAAGHRPANWQPEAACDAATARAHVEAALADWTGEGSARGGASPLPLAAPPPDAIRALPPPPEAGFAEVRDYRILGVTVRLRFIEARHARLVDPLFAHLAYAGGDPADVTVDIVPVPGAGGAGQADTTPPLSDLAGERPTGAGAAGDGIGF